MVREQAFMMSAGADIKANTWGGSALERGHGTPLEPLAERSDALSGVLAVPIPVDATELVAKEIQLQVKAQKHK